jgi:hypothetical protein
MSVHTRMHHTKILESSHSTHAEKRKTWREVLGITELNEAGRVLKGFRIKEETSEGTGLQTLRQTTSHF